MNRASWKNRTALSHELNCYVKVANMGQRFALWLLGSIVLLSFANPAVGGIRIANSDVIQLKGAFLYKFAHYITWPDRAFADAEQPIVIGILGEDPFGPFLDRAVAERRAQDRSLRIRRFATLQDLQACHILFVSSSAAPALDEIAESLQDSTILTVADIAGFANRGGAVEFALVGDNMQLKVNIDVVSRSQLSISSRLLKLVEIVKDEKNNE